jgi:hypothetical protein
MVRARNAARNRHKQCERHTRWDHTTMNQHAQCQRREMVAHHEEQGHAVLTLSTSVVRLLHHQCRTHHQEQAVAAPPTCTRMAHHSQNARAVSTMNMRVCVWQHLSAVTIHTPSITRTTGWSISSRTVSQQIKIHSAVKDIFSCQYRRVCSRSVVCVLSKNHTERRNGVSF